MGLGVLILKKIWSQKACGTVPLKVYKNENFFGFDFEICTFS
jgi:hypothetical protein